MIRRLTSTPRSGALAVRCGGLRTDSHEVTPGVNMQQRAFLKHIDEILDLPPGTVRGDEVLADIEGWDSLAVVGFIAIVNQHFGVTLVAKDIQGATSLPALLSLIPAG